MFNIELTHDLDDVLDHVRSLQDKIANPDLLSTSDIVVKRFRSAISGGGFTPLSIATREIRSRVGISGSRPLVATGELARSIRVVSSRNDSMSVGSLLSRAGFLRAGGVTDSASMIPGKRVPQRDYLPIDAGLLDSMTQKMIDKIKE